MCTKIERRDFLESRRSDRGIGFTEGERRPAEEEREDRPHRYHVGQRPRRVRQLPTELRLQGVEPVVPGASIRPISSRSSKTSAGSDITASNCSVGKSKAWRRTAGWRR